MLWGEIGFLSTFTVEKNVNTFWMNIHCTHITYMWINYRAKDDLARIHKVARDYFQAVGMAEPLFHIQLHSCSSS